MIDMSCMLQSSDTRFNNILHKVQVTSAHYIDIPLSTAKPTCMQESPYFITFNLAQVRLWTTEQLPFTLNKLFNHPKFSISGGVHCLYILIINIRWPQYR